MGSAASASDGWDSPIITTNTLKAAQKVKTGVAEFEQDGVVREKIIYSETILAFLLLVTSKQNNCINIIDFGGGLGTNYYQSRKRLHGMVGTKVRRQVVERPILASLGEKYFQIDELKFYSNLEEPMSGTMSSNSEPLLFSGSLQYLSDPFAVLDEAIEGGIRLIGLDRLLMSTKSKHSIFIQRPNPRTHYAAIYPVRCFSRDAFVAWFASKGFTLLELFTGFPGPNFDHCGMIFVR
jgi:putative methyltransferase (TIGR04325 family)